MLCPKVDRVWMLYQAVAKAWCWARGLGFNGSDEGLYDSVCWCGIPWMGKSTRCAGALVVSLPRSSGPGG